MPTLHRTVDTEVFPIRTGSTSAERVAVDRRRDSAKAQSGFAVSYSRGRKVPIYSAPCPRKESKTIVFGGVLWVLSVAGDRKYPAGGICVPRGAVGDDPSGASRLLPLRRGGFGVTDCHGQCAHWLRNDMAFYMERWLSDGGVWSPRPTFVFLFHFPFSYFGEKAAQ